jgi:hypothetical protein
MKQEWERTHKTWAIRKGFLRGVAATSERHSTKTGTHNSRASTPPSATQPPYKSSNISKQDGVRSTSRPRKIYAWHTTQSGTARSTSQPSENASTTTRFASSASDSSTPVGAGRVRPPGRSGGGGGTRRRGRENPFRPSGRKPPPDCRRHRGIVHPPIAVASPPSPFPP